MKCNPDITDFLDRIYKEEPLGKNMFQATLSLEMEYGVSPQDAESLIIDWMERYEERNNQRRPKRSNSSIPEQRREDYTIRAFAFSE